MAREKSIWKDGKFVPLKKEPKKQVHAVIQDTMNPIESMATADGQIFDSRSAYLRHLKEHGYEVTGGDHLSGKSLADYRYKTNRQELFDTIAKQYNLCKWGMAPLNQKEIASWRTEQKELRAIKREKRYRVKRFFQLKAQAQQQSQTL